MAPPAASATARLGASRRARSRSKPASGGTFWSALGWLIGSLFWWFIWWPLRTLARGLWACVRWAFHRPLRALLVVGLIAVALSATYWMWFRNSSFVRVERIRVEGTTTQIDDINTALASAAAGMTTLNADAGTLADALARFPTVRSVSIQSDFPHGLIVHIDEMPPVALVSTGDQLLPVAGDGRILAGISASQLNLPTIESGSGPSNGMVTGDALQQAEVMGAAPPELRPLAEESTMISGGVVIRMRGGVELRFGSADEAAEKWTAAAAVMADKKLDNASYIDLQDPARPAVGGDPAALQEPTTSDLAGTATTTTPTAATTTAAPTTDTTSPSTSVTGSTAAAPVDPAAVPTGTDAGTTSASTGAVAP
jgi:cell division septal protein FtsQ